MFFFNKKNLIHEATSTLSFFVTTEVETYYQEMDKSSSPQIIIHLRCPFGTAFGTDHFLGRDERFSMWKIEGRL